MVVGDDGVGEEKILGMGFPFFPFSLLRDFILDIFLLSRV